MDARADLAIQQLDDMDRRFRVLSDYDLLRRIVEPQIPKIVDFYPPELWAPTVQLLWETARTATVGSLVSLTVTGQQVEQRRKGGAEDHVFYTGNNVMPLCIDTAPKERHDNDARYSSCLTYLAGLWDATVVWRLDGRLTSPTCVPAGTRPERLRQVFIEYGFQRPEFLHYSAGSIALGAFTAAWPCP